MDKKITDEANAVIDEVENMDDRKAIVVYNPGWHKGVIGIVASRLTEKYYRPAVVLTKSSELITGAARSVTGFDIYKAIESCRDLLENFGGHTYAAGLSLREENLEAFTERFLKIASEEIIPEQMIPQIDIDAILDLKEINQKFVNDLKTVSYTHLLSGKLQGTQAKKTVLHGHVDIRFMIRMDRADREVMLRRTFLCLVNL